MPIEILTIEPSGPGEFRLCGHGVYEDSSVLAGQCQFLGVGYYDSIEDAQDAADAEYPGIPCEVIDHNTGSTAVVPSLPPAGFDPADAGEVWGEEEY